MLQLITTLAICFLMVYCSRRRLASVVGPVVGGISHLIIVGVLTLIPWILATVVAIVLYHWLGSVGLLGAIFVLLFLRD